MKSNRFHSSAMRGWMRSERKLITHNISSWRRQSWCFSVAGAWIASASAQQWEGIRENNLALCCYQTINILQAAQEFKSWLEWSLQTNRNNVGGREGRGRRREKKRSSSPLNLRIVHVCGLGIRAELSEFFHLLHSALLCAFGCFPPLCHLECRGCGVRRVITWPYIITLTYHNNS